MLDINEKFNYYGSMNRKSIQERAHILNLLVEGSSLRATSRIASCSINTVTKLLVETGEACSWYQDKHLVNLPCKKIEVDEIWSFVYSKQQNVPEGKEDNAGDVWTWTALCPDTKLIPTWRVGSRDKDTAFDFMNDLAKRMANRIQLTSDGFYQYPAAVYEGFGDDVDYAMLMKIYQGTVEGQRRYSMSKCVGAQKKALVGDPDPCCISTSGVERQNLNMRMSMRRFTRLTNGFSKKVENHAHAVALHFMNYNFARIHKSLKISPAMAAGVSQTLWNLEDVVKMSDDYWGTKQKENTSN